MDLYHLQAPELAYVSSDRYAKSPASLSGTTTPSSQHALLSPPRPCSVPPPPRNVCWPFLPERLLILLNPDDCHTRLNHMTSPILTILTYANGTSTWFNLIVNATLSSCFMFLFFMFLSPERVLSLQRECKSRIVEGAQADLNSYLAIY